MSVPPDTVKLTNYYFLVWSRYPVSIWCFI